MNFDSILDTTIDIALAAGAILRDGFGHVAHVSEKSSAGDWVTEYDIAAETTILEGLTAAFPDHHIVSEESGTNHVGSLFSWYIDPLDGTNNFAHGLPHFCTSLALYEGAAPLLGVIYDPLKDELFTAVAGQGAFLTRGGRRTRLQVSQTARLDHSLVATGFPYDKHISPQDNTREASAFLKRVQGLRRMGSAALDMAYVAAARFHGYWEFKLNSWDIAAGALLVTEAGGLITGMTGESIAIAPKVNLVVSNGRLHTDMLAILATVPQPNATTWTASP